MKINFRIKSKIYALGIGGSFRGIHVHNIIGDDIVVEENSSTHDLRQWIFQKFLGAAGGLKLNGNRTKVILVGTPQHHEDILMTIARNDDKGWNKIKQIAVELESSKKQIHSLVRSDMNGHDNFNFFATV